eukprot:1915370-Rhodomonas_salina.1
MRNEERRAHARTRHVRVHRHNSLAAPSLGPESPLDVGAGKLRHRLHHARVLERHAVHLRARKVNAHQVAPREVAPGQHRLNHARPRQLHLRQPRAAQVQPVQVAPARTHPLLPRDPRRVLDCGTAQVALGHVGADEVGAVQARVPQPPLHHLDAAQIRAAHVDPRRRAARRAGPAEVCALEVAVVELAVGEVRGEQEHARELAPPQLPELQLRPRQVAPLEHRPLPDRSHCARFRHLGAGPVDARDRRVVERDVLGESAAAARAVELRVLEVRADNVGAVQVGLAQVRALQVGVPHVDAREVGAAQLDPPQRRAVQHKLREPDAGR